MESTSDWRQVVALEALADALMLTGVLILPERAQVRLLSEWVARLPPRLSKRWEVFLSMGGSAFVVADSPWSPRIEDSECLQDLSAVASRVRVVVLHDDRADLLGFMPDEFSRDIDGMEVVRFSATGSSRRLSQAAAPGHFQEGESREDFWREHIEFPVSVSRTLTIVDAYAGKALVGNLTHGDGIRSGPAWFLQRLAARERPPGVRLFTRQSHPSSDARNVYRSAEIGDACRALMARSPAVKDLRLELHLLHPDRGPHDRHVRFGDRLHVALGNGLESFNGSRAIQTFTYARIPPAEAHDRERRARDATAEVLSI